MKLIIGGVAQGKLAIAKQLCESGYRTESACSTNIALDVNRVLTIVDENFDSIEELYTANIINHFHLIIRRLLIENIELEHITEQIVKKNPAVIIVSTEIGYGIVPMDSFEREYRERTGRICCKIVEGAEEVYRVVCGIATKMK
ncbi:bifunctional adenosylcobinamide kinase/adenosylcobinamide-phosphate guanylyltransferase [Anaerosporobacter sp.]|uniref:bifunctional adenosylcobinamide kinase/adenosylcobinamide-phosphate guanylyltransferase n=1 Tax=Anaerosporobacter sp. TaxID=1872529 RepID=UPI00286EEE97|nr:bifunctional adenosylcobinamide kinase/adenosylcobinamide-phosphate guanylyltransferase [Anaerosporobacter sp.]